MRSKISLRVIVYIWMNNDCRNLRWTEEEFFSKK